MSGSKNVFIKSELHNLEDTEKELIKLQNDDYKNSSKLDDDIDNIRVDIDTKTKMLEIIIENNEYKKKVIYTIISILFLMVLVMIVCFIYFSKKLPKLPNQ